MKKVKHRNLTNRLSHTLLAFLLAFSTLSFSQEVAEAAPANGGGDVALGKTLFNANCAACHKRYNKSVGPALHGVTSRHDLEWIYSWIKNSAAMVKSGDAAAVAIFDEYNGSPMTAFPALSNGDIDNILAYAEVVKTDPVPTATTAGGESSAGGVSNNIILGILALVFLMLFVMLLLVNKTLRRIAEANGVEYEQQEKRLPIWKAFAQNQFLVFVTAILLLLSSGYFVYGYLSQIGVDQGYAPVQPIHFSHKIHAGANEIDCTFCHSSARTSKTSGIPSLNVCMNCHKNISDYAGEEDLEKGYTKDFYTGEIKKLYDAVGWDEENQRYTGETEPVEWVRIHNLPDFAYFNHSQHVTVAGVDCKKCHGLVEEMEIVSQFAPLTMGWCIDCHRETNINVESNEYYTKIHAELSKKYGVDKLTAAQMGGLECGKCHY